MKNESKREKFLFWLIKNSYKWWLWVPVVMISCALIGSGIGGLGGLALTLYGALAFAAGINLALETTLGVDYATKDLWKKNAKDK